MKVYAWISTHLGLLCSFTNDKTIHGRGALLRCERLALRSCNLLMVWWTHASLPTDHQLPSGYWSDWSLVLHVLSMHNEGSFNTTTLLWSFDHGWQLDHMAWRSTLVWIILGHISDMSRSLHNDFPLIHRTFGICVLRIEPFCISKSNVMCCHGCRVFNEEVLMVADMRDGLWN